MSDIVVHLDAYVIPDKHAIWKCFPGKTYRFYEIVRDAEVVFLDVRGLDGLPKDPASWPDKDALEILAADRWARELRRTRHDGKPRGSADVSPVDRRTLTFLKGLLLSAKKGDLIVVPAEGYRKDVLIGEFLTNPGEIVRHQAADDGAEQTYVGRPVRWRAAQEKRQFSKELIELLHTPTAFFLLPRGLYEEVYRLAYKNFILDNVFTSTFTTTKQHFSTSDSAVVGMWFNALAAVRDAIDGARTIEGLAYADLGLLETNNPTEGELSININSPGEYLIRSFGVFALVVMAMLPLTDLTAQEIINNTIKVTLNEIGDNNSDCPLKIEAAIADYAKTLSVDRLRQACIIGKRARAEATLGTKAKLVAPPKKSK